MSKKDLHGLYAITPDDGSEAGLLTSVEAALRGGAAILQYRDKRRPPDRRREIARALRQLCREFGALFIVNDDLELARSVDADGVHLGGSDGDLAAAKRAVGPGRILGASCYADFDLAVAAAQAGADYVAFGAVFASPTKPHAVRADLALFGRCRDELGVPSCAIGGITLENAPPLLAAGADLLAVITDLFSAPDIAARAAQYQQLFERA